MEQETSREVYLRHLGNLSCDLVAFGGGVHARCGGVRWNVPLRLIYVEMEMWDVRGLGFQRAAKHSAVLACQNFECSLKFIGAVDFFEVVRLRLDHRLVRHRLVRIPTSVHLPVTRHRLPPAPRAGVRCCTAPGGPTVDPRWSCLPQWVVEGVWAPVGPVARLLRPTVRPEVRPATARSSEPSFLSLLRQDRPLSSGLPFAGWPTQRVFL